MFCYILLLFSHFFCPLWCMNINSDCNDIKKKEFDQYLKQIKNYMQQAKVPEEKTYSFLLKRLAIKYPNIINDEKIADFTKSLPHELGHFLAYIDYTSEINLFLGENACDCGIFFNRKLKTEKTNTTQSKDQNTEILRKYLKIFKFLMGPAAETVTAKEEVGAMFESAFNSKWDLEDMNQVYYNSNQTSGSNVNEFFNILLGKKVCKKKNDKPVIKSVIPNNKVWRENVLQYVCKKRQTVKIRDNFYSKYRGHDIFEALSYCFKLVKILYPALSYAETEKRAYGLYFVLLGNAIDVCKHFDEEGFFSSLLINFLEEMADSTVRGKNGTFMQEKKRIRVNFNKNQTDNNGIDIIKYAKQIIEKNEFLKIFYSVYDSMVLDSCFVYLDLNVKKKENALVKLYLNEQLEARLGNDIKRQNLRVYFKEFYNNNSLQVNAHIIDLIKDAMVQNINKKKLLFLVNTSMRQIDKIIKMQCKDNLLTLHKMIDFLCATLKGYIHEESYNQNAGQVMKRFGEKKIIMIEHSISGGDTRGHDTQYGSQTIEDGGFFVESLFLMFRFINDIDKFIFSNEYIDNVVANFGLLYQKYKEKLRRQVSQLYNNSGHTPGGGQLNSILCQTIKDIQSQKIPRPKNDDAVSRFIYSVFPDENITESFERNFGQLKDILNKIQGDQSALGENKKAMLLLMSQEESNDEKSLAGKHILAYMSQ